MYSCGQITLEHKTLSTIIEDVHQPRADTVQEPCG